MYVPLWTDTEIFSHFPPERNSVAVMVSPKSNHGWNHFWRYLKRDQICHWNSRVPKRRNCKNHYKSAKFRTWYAPLSFLSKFSHKCRSLLTSYQLTILSVFWFGCLLYGKVLFMVLYSCEYLTIVIYLYIYIY